MGLVSGGGENLHLLKGDDAPPDAELVDGPTIPTGVSTFEQRRPIGVKLVFAINVHLKRHHSLTVRNVLGKIRAENTAIEISGLFARSVTMRQVVRFGMSAP